MVPFSQTSVMAHAWSPSEAVLSVRGGGRAGSPPATTVVHRAAYRRGFMYKSFLGIELWLLLHGLHFGTLL